MKGCALKTLLASLVLLDSELAVLLHTNTATSETYKQARMKELISKRERK